MVNDPLPSRAEMKETAVKTARTALIHYAVDLLWEAPSYVRQKYRDRHSIVVDLGNDAASEALFLFLADQGVGHGDYSHFQARIIETADLSLRDLTSGRGGGHSGPPTAPTPPEAPGDGSAEEIVRVGPAPVESSFSFTYDGNQFDFEVRERTPSTKQVKQKGATAYRSYVLRAWHGGVEDVRSLLADAVRHYAQEATGGVSVHMLDPWNGWMELREKAPRTLEDVSYPIREWKGESKGLGAHVVEACREFLSNKRWHERMGVPWRRTYLFYGPPGTGKSSLAEVIAGELGIDLYQVSVGQGRLDDDELMTVLSQTDPRSLILVEDVDEATSSPSGEKSITYRGLSNALDGVAAQEGRIIVLTTNRKEEIDERLLRAERVHEKIYFGPCTPRQIEALFDKFFPDYEPGWATFEQGVQEHADCLVPAEVQKICRTHRDNAEKAMRVLVDTLYGEISHHE